MAPILLLSLDGTVADEDVDSEQAKSCRPKPYVIPSDKSLLYTAGLQFIKPHQEGWWLEAQIAT
jgi:hypothetical protein